MLELVLDVLELELVLLVLLLELVLLVLDELLVELVLEELELVLLVLLLLDVEEVEELLELELLVVVLVELVLVLLELLLLELVVLVEVEVQIRSTHWLVESTHNLYFLLSLSQNIFPGSAPWGNCPAVPPGRFFSLIIRLNRSSWSVALKSAPFIYCPCCTPGLFRCNVLSNPESFQEGATGFVLILSRLSIAYYHFIKPVAVKYASNPSNANGFPPELSSILNRTLRHRKPLGKKYSSVSFGVLLSVTQSWSSAFA